MTITGVVRGDGVSHSIYTTKYGTRTRYQPRATLWHSTVPSSETTIIMPSVLATSLVALSLAAVGYATPLSTHPYELPRERASLSFAPLVAADHPHGTVNNSYIVMLRDDLPSALMQNHFNFLQNVQQAHPLMDDLEGGLRHVYDGHIKGYSGKFSEGTVERIRQMPEVEYIEMDQIVRTLEIDAGAEGVKTQKGAPWVSFRPLSCPNWDHRAVG